VQLLQQDGFKAVDANTDVICYYGYDVSSAAAAAGWV